MDGLGVFGKLSHLALLSWPLDALFYAHWNFCCRVVAVTVGGSGERSGRRVRKRRLRSRWRKSIFGRRLRCSGEAAS